MNEMNKDHPSGEERKGQTILRRLDLQDWVSCIGSQSDQKGKGTPRILTETAAWTVAAFTEIETERGAGLVRKMVNFVLDTMSSRCL